MFKDVQSSEILERSKESEKNKGFYIVTKYRTITCIDFDDGKSIVENIKDEKEISPSEFKILKTEEEFEFYGADDLQWYDVVSLGIARAIRKKKYKVYKINYYQVGDKIIKGPRVFDRIEFY